MDMVNTSPHKGRKVMTRKYRAIYYLRLEDNFLQIYMAGEKGIS